MAQEMTDFSHSWRGADQSNVRKKCNEGQAQRQWRNKMARIKRIQAGQIQQDDRDSLIRYHRDAVRKGEFAGTLDRWLEIHQVELPPSSSRSHKATSPEDPTGRDLVSQSLMDSAAQVLGPDGHWVLWALLIAAKQIPPSPNKNRNVAALVA